MSNLQSNPLSALSPLDGRYKTKCEGLTPYFSEYGLMRYRVLVEVKWLQKLAVSKSIQELDKIDADDMQALNSLYEDFSLDHAQRIKDIEKKTNHDVKAVEYFIKEKLGDKKSLDSHLEFVHFACTSEDINNLAYGLMLKEGRDHVMLPVMQEIIQQLATLSKENSDQPLLSRTHGQPASPTTVGKEFANVVYRLRRQLKQIESQNILGKINGAVGNFNAHLCAYPDTDWPGLAQEFVTELGLNWK